MINPTPFTASTLPFLACIETFFPRKVTVGSGTLIAPRIILTAGHVVFDPRLGGKAIQFRVTLGADPRSAFFPVTTWETTSQWMNRDSTLGKVQRSLAFTDVGVVVLDKPIDSVVPTQKLDTMKSEELEASLLNIAGYSPDPSEFPETAFFARSRGVIMKDVRHRITYPVKTFGGMSGGPVWTNPSGDRTVRAIHTSIYKGRGNALRITEPVFELIHGWQNKFRPGQTAVT